MPRHADEAGRIEAYTRARYVVGARVPSMDEPTAARALDAYLSQCRFAPGESCAYLGILWFEVSFQDEEDARSCLSRARVWLFRARTRCPERWDAVEDRITDVDAMLDSMTEE